jgi:uncharacterized protein
LLALIRKRTAAAKDARQQFVDANRQDLKDKEDAQIAVLEEYAGQVATISVDEIRGAISQAIEQVKGQGKKVEVGSVLKALFSPGGLLDGRPAERAEVARIAKQAVAEV